MWINAASESPISTTLARIKSLVIPPAWQDVWITPHSNGHLQGDRHGCARPADNTDITRAIERFATNRKYDRMSAFAAVLPRLRRRTQRDLRLPGLPRDKVLAAVVRVMEKTLIRVGNEEYAKQNKSFGLTTIRNRHVKVLGKKMHFEFRGKSGVEHEIDLEDPTFGADCS